MKAFLIAQIRGRLFKLIQISLENEFPLLTYLLLIKTSLENESCGISDLFVKNLSIILAKK